MGSVKSWLTYLLRSPQRHACAGPLRPRAPHLLEFKPGHTVAFTDKHLRECVGTIVGIKPKTCSLLPAVRRRAMARGAVTAAGNHRFRT